MSGRLNEVDTGVHSVVNQLEPVDTVLLLEIGVEARLDVVDNWFPAMPRVSFARSPSRNVNDPPLVVVHVVTEARRIDNSEFKTHTGLFDLCKAKGSAKQHLGFRCALTRCIAFNLHRFASVLTGQGYLLCVIQFGFEQRVDQSGLS
jgi:hypothetical protein